MVLVLGKARSHRAPNLAVGAESPGWFDVLQKLCTRCDTWVGGLLWQSCQSPVAHSCGLLNHPNSICRGMFKPNTRLDVDSLLYSLNYFECKATQKICPLNSIYRPQWLVHWSHLCSHMNISLHLLWLPGYMDVMQTVLIIFAMAGFVRTDLDVCVEFKNWVIFCL